MAPIRGLVDHDQDESTLDAEWSGAVAPAASVNLVVAATTATTDGVDLAAHWIVNHAAAPVVSVSYGSCEQEMGAAELAFYNSLWEQAASQGMSVFVASGDAGAAGCSAAADKLGTGSAVNGLCSSPYSTCVGGTEFNEGANAAQYWSTANSPGYGSALALHPRGSLERERVERRDRIVGVRRRRKRGVRAARMASRRGRRSRCQRYASRPGRLAGGRRSRWLFHRGERIVLDCLGHLRGQRRRLPASWRWWSKVSTALRKATPMPGCMLWRAQWTIRSTQRHRAITAFPASRVSPPRGATYNLATGLGSVDAALLVNNWSLLSNPPTLALTAAAKSVTVSQGGSATLAFTAATGGSFAGASVFPSLACRLASRLRGPRIPSQLPRVPAQIMSRSP